MGPARPRTLMTAEARVNFSSSAAYETNEFTFEKLAAWLRVHAEPPSLQRAQ
jgi:hypothetical protein